MSILEWPALRNARDLGGLATSGGGRIRPRALIRTDNHGRLDASGIAALGAYGVARVIDLRWEWEAETYPSKLAADPRYRLIPASFDPEGTEDIPADSYRLMLDLSRDRLAAVLTAIASAPPGGVVLHCHAGRDRTGVVTALTLSLAGVHPHDIAADYALTAEALPETMLNTLDHLESAYGGAEPYLTGAGVTPSDIAAVRARLT